MRDQRTMVMTMGILMIPLVTSEYLRTSLTSKSKGHVGYQARV